MTIVITFGAYNHKEKSRLNISIRKDPKYFPHAESLSLNQGNAKRSLRCGGSTNRILLPGSNRKKRKGKNISVRQQPGAPLSEIKNPAEATFFLKKREVILW